MSNINNLYYTNYEIQGKRMNIGGDHSMSIASCAYSLNKHPELKILWFDAHADINSYKKSVTKNYHGMPLHFLSNLSSNKTDFPFITTNLNLKNLMYIGLRDVDEYEQEIIDTYKIKVIKSDDFNNDPNRSLQKIYSFLKNSPFHLSFDVDCLDPSVVPCTGTMVNNGLYKTQTRDVMKNLMMHQNLINMDLTELNIDEDFFNNEDKEKSIQNVVDIIF